MNLFKRSQEISQQPRVVSEIERVGTLRDFDGEDDISGTSRDCSAQSCFSSTGEEIEESSYIQAHAAHEDEGELRGDAEEKRSFIRPALAPLLYHPRKQRIANRKLTLIACVGAFVALAVVVLAGIAVTDQAAQSDFAIKNLPPSISHLFGTDWMGRDMFLRTLAGLSTSILVGLFAAIVSALIALVLGTAAALGGKKVDSVISWLIDLMMGVPHIVLLILISFALGKGFWGVAIGVAVTHWPSLARVIRAEVLQCKNAEYVAVARKLGKSRFSIATHHVMPYVLPQFLVGLVLLFPHAILHEAAVTFLGFGLPPEMPAIGVILSESMGYLSAGMWWLAVFPGLALVLVVLLFDVAGSNLRKLLDPHSSQE